MFNANLSSTVRECLQDEASYLTLAYHGLGDRGLAALSVPLLTSDHVHTLNITDNAMTSSGMKYLCDVMKDNISVINLDISVNKFGHKGLKNLTEMLKLNRVLRTLVAKECHIDDNDGEDIGDAIKNNDSLILLNLSGNKLGVQSGTALGEALGVNNSLKTLDLSWNHIRLGGAIDLAKGIKANESLERVDISWNGFSDKGAVALGSMLSQNKQLLELNICSNRISFEGCVHIAKGLKSNTTLRRLKLSRNPIRSLGALNVLEAIKNNHQSPLTRLDLVDVDIDRRFEELLKDLHTKYARPIVVRHGIRVRDEIAYLYVSPVDASMGDPLIMLMEYVKQSSLRLMDLFAQFDRDNSMTVSRREFKIGLKAKLPMSNMQIDKLIDRLDKDRNGEIDFGELLEGQRLYRERERKKALQIETPINSRPGSPFTRPDSRNKVHAPRLMMTTELGKAAILSVDSIRSDAASSSHQLKIQNRILSPIRMQRLRSNSMRNENSTSPVLSPTFPLLERERSSTSPNSLNLLSPRVLSGVSTTLSPRPRASSINRASLLPTETEVPELRLQNSTF